MNYTFKLQFQILPVLKSPGKAGDMWSRPPPVFWDELIFLCTMKVIQYQKVIYFLTPVSGSSVTTFHTVA